MNRKITRRVAIGTILSGLLACPLALYYWRRKSDLQEFPSVVRWRELWTTFTREVIPTIVPFHFDKSFICEFSPNIGSSANYSILTPIIEPGNVFDIDNVPEMYGLTKGVFDVLSIDENILFKGKGIRNQIVTSSNNLVTNPGTEDNWLLLKNRESSLIPVEMIDNQLRHPNSLTLLYSVKPFQVFGIDAPKKSLTVGSTWEVQNPPDEGLAGTVTRKVSGFCRINEEEDDIVKIVTEKTVVPNDLFALFEEQMKSYQSAIDQQKLIGEMEQVRKTQPIIETYCESYFRLTTGILVYRKVISSYYEGRRKNLISQNVNLTRVHY
ncbi:MAG: hypothetical protein LBC68_13540 [Prevotellaceae bacterium]|jgi:hypothetical protein|nr:hypothetical protein [Prevotellaceae bacterium]